MLNKDIPSDNIINEILDLSEDYALTEYDVNLLNRKEEIQFIKNNWKNSTVCEVNNFKVFREFMKINPLKENEFYFLQILIRGKDGHTEPGINGNNKNRLIKMYTIKSEEDLDRYEKDIINISKLLNARVYIHPTKRNFTEVAAKMLELFPNVFLSNPKGLKRIYSTACGQSYVSKEKLYVIDLDGEDANKEDEIINFIDSQCEPLNKKKYIYTFPTVHGKHLIVSPFNVQKFCQQYVGIDVHKNNPTLLYYSKSNY